MQVAPDLHRPRPGFSSPAKAPHCLSVLHPPRCRVSALLLPLPCSVLWAHSCWRGLCSREGCFPGGPLPDRPTQAPVTQSQPVFPWSLACPGLARCIPQSLLLSTALPDHVQEEGRPQSSRAPAVPGAMPSASSGVLVATPNSPARLQVSAPFLHLGSEKGNHLSKVANGWQRWKLNVCVCLSLMLLFFSAVAFFSDPKL